MADLNGTVIYLNDVAANIVDLSVEECVGRNFSEVFRVFRFDTGAVIGDPVKRAIESGKTIGLEKNAGILSRDGAHKYLSATCSPIKNAKKIITGSVAILRDITRIRNLEVRIQQESESLKLVFNSSPVGMMLVDEGGDIVDINQSALLTMRVNKDAVIGKQFGIAFGCVGALEKKSSQGLGRRCEDCSLRSAIRQSLENDKAIHDMEMFMEFSNGQTPEAAWLRVSVSPTQFGGKKNVILTLIDITERKKQELEVEQSRDLYLRILESFPGMVWWIKNNELIYINRQCEEFIGLPQEEIMGEQWLKVMHPDDRQRYLNEYKDEDHFEMEVRVRHRSGEYFWLWCMNRPFIDVAGKRDGVIGIGFDITDKKNIELAVERNRSQYQSLFMNMSSGFTYNFILTNENGAPVDFQHIECNANYEEIAGVKKEKIIGHKFFDLFPEDILPSQVWLEESGAIALKGEGRLDKEIYFPSRNRWYSLSVYSFEKMHFAAIFTDITERKQTEEQLKKSKKAAEEANRAKSSFLANMSHEIRTPINGMVGMIDLTLMSKLTEEQQENLQVAKSCANSLLIIINDILDFSKMEAGKLILESVGFNLREAIDHVVRAHSVKAEEKGLDFYHSLGSSLPKVILGDPTRLKQILNNLISNAIKFTGAGSVSLSVKKKIDEQGRKSLAFSVKDTGIGLDESDMRKLFKVFSQVDSSITRKFGGTGLGLMISKQLIEMMGGKIWLTSKKGEGSTFYVSLPYQEIFTELSEEPPPRNILETFTPRRVLLVEDDAVNQLVLSKILKEIRYNVKVVGTGSQAVESVRKESFDCILMDIQMPDMDGVEATARIRRLEKEAGKYTPIIALTAYAIKGDREKLLSYGMDEYISKPVNIDELHEKIGAAVQMKLENIQASKDSFDISDVLAYCQNESGTKERKRDAASAQKITDMAWKLRDFIQIGNFDAIEKQAELLKEAGKSEGYLEIRDLGFKIQLAARRENIHEIAGHMSSLQELVEDLA